ncbi:putative short-chain dehydrogenase/reductase family protein [Aspergillus ruber CBS 135680]|uniref:Putative short-chain dehydrogenase/reductase family protein n=1 Tax=Aspergillus ruber (strain CBS 135680) TaxID=1388766 RepID=A0A017SRC1_ASPRC|nr:putative short-chain dehydrogenase/reductase family protein [Aspergillus ruber CBS 135680]EYE99381.1 putative short-chain dehydrogenase/reductase family protein [Aspergillus ruber CBS 135680]
MATSPTSNPASSPPKPPSRGKKWHHHITIDLFLSVLNRTLLHPWFAWMTVLSLRAQATPYTDLSFILTSTYASLLTILALARAVNHRIAYGLSRPVNLSEEVVVVTGGASGLGLLVARIYGLRGVSVAVFDVKEVAEIEGWSDEVAGVEYYRCDIGNRREVEWALGRVKKELGTPTVLVNCAAARINGQSLLSLPAEAFQRTIRTNLLAVFNTCQVVLPDMLSAPNGGAIVNVSSVLGQLHAAGLSDYSASKAALSALHKTLEVELRVSGNYEKVKMLLVETGQLSTPLFGWIQTPSNFFAPVLEPVQVAQEIVAAIDEGRGGVIRLPAFAALARWYAVFPAGLQRIARWLSGIDHAVAKASPARPPSNRVAALQNLQSDSESVDTD